MRRCLWCVLFLVAVPLHAQSARSRLRDLFHFGTCDTLVCLSVGVTGSQHGAHYNPDAAITLTSLIDFLSNGIATSVGNVPLGGTSSGLTVTFDQNGLPVTTQGSTGSIFGERSQTLGRGRATFGVNVTGASFQSLRGVKLSHLQSTLTHEDEAPAGLGNPLFEFDTIHVDTDLNASIAAYTAFITYGLSNRVDIGIAMPVVNVKFDGTSIAHIYNMPGDTLHVFSVDSLGKVKVVDTATTSSNTSGIGDIAVRLKVNLAQSPRAGAALFADVRLPTGKADDLLGSGHFSARGLAVASAKFGFLSPHINAGYLYRSGDNQNSALLGTVGFDALVLPSVTLAGDMIGQWQVGAGKVPLPPPVTYVDGSVVQRTTIPNMKDNVVGASVGAKFAIGPVLTAVTNVIFPLTDGGLRSNVIWTFGAEMNFGVKFAK